MPEEYAIPLVEVSKSVNRFVIVADDGQGIHVLLDLADDLRIEGPFALKPLPDR